MKLLQTIPTGQAVAVWDKNGTYEIIKGPRRLVTGFKRVNFLQKYVARPNQYLRITFTNGEAAHVNGPAEAFLDPIVHTEIQVLAATEIDANEAIVVYHDEGGAVQRHIVRGPALHFPTADEWQHEFQWHGSQGGDHEAKLAGALRFTKMRVIPDQMYFRVDAVRTQDEAILDVKLMIFFELVDIERMLDQTHDPVVDFINALTADIMDFTTGKPFEVFKNQVDQLNERATYRQLLERAERIGYEINKVVYRGYAANDTLQTMHDQAIEARTRLALEAETEAQAQQLADLKQVRELERQVRLREQAEATAAHERKLAELAHAAELEQLRAQQANEIEQQQALYTLEERHQAEQNGQKVALLQGMQAAGVDLTPVLVAENRNPDRHIRIDGQNAPQVHMYEN